MAVFYAPGWERAVTILKEGSTSKCFQFTLSQRHVWQLEALSLRSRIFGFAAFKNQVRHPQSTETDLVIQVNLNLKMIWSTMNSFIWKCCCSFLLKKTSDFISTWHHCSLWFGARDQTCCWLQSGQGVTLWWLRNIPLSERLWKREKRTKLKTERAFVWTASAILFSTVMQMRSSGLRKTLGKRTEWEGESYWNLLFHMEAPLFIIKR